jgi:hypothetical protein
MLNLLPLLGAPQERGQVSNLASLSADTSVSENPSSDYRHRATSNAGLVRPMAARGRPVLGGLHHEYTIAA